ncbi:hypothetical protein [Rubrivirga sp. IMCC45206]|uniref:hypothetical protein n=1 Tax=Rubrivirga sp. IMCC45206 TaxID=3391614 RepID=UPI0039902602
MTPLQPTVPASTSSAAPARPGAVRGKDALSPDEAARQFESVLVRQFVEVMTKDLFQSDQEGMMTGQADLQRDTLTDTLTDHLVDAGTFGIAELLTAQWERAGRVPETLPAPSPDTERPDPTFFSDAAKAPAPPFDMPTRTP